MYGCKTGIILSPEGLSTVQTNIRSRKCRRETICIPSKLAKAATKHPFGSISHWRWMVLSVQFYAPTTNGDNIVNRACKFQVFIEGSWTTYYLPMFTSTYVHPHMKRQNWKQKGNNRYLMDEGIPDGNPSSQGEVTSGPRTVEPCIFWELFVVTK